MINNNVLKMKPSNDVFFNSKGSVVVKLEIVTSKNATTDDVRDILQAIATNNSTLAIDEKSISVAGRLVALLS